MQKAAQFHSMILTPFIRGFLTSLILDVSRLANKVSFVAEEKTSFSCKGVSKIEGLPFKLHCFLAARFLTNEVLGCSQWLESIKNVSFKYFSFGMNRQLESIWIFAYRNVVKWDFWCDFKNTVTL